MADSPITALVCTGGGAIGAYQVGVLKYIHEHFCEDQRSPFQLFSGISCGAISAGFLACHSHRARDAQEQLEQLWRKFHVPEYQRTTTRTIVRSLLRSRRRPSLLDPKPMQQIIAEGFSREGLKAAFAAGTTLGVGVAATEVVSGYGVWFMDGPRAREWDRFHSVGKREPFYASHIEASCSIPFFLPPVQLGDHYYVDGGVRINRPFSAAIAMGASRLLCIRTGIDEKHALPTYRRGFRPGLGTLANLLVKSITDDFALSEREQINVLNRLHAEVVGQGYEAQRRDNAIFERGFDVRDYQPIEVGVITPSIKPSRLYERFCARQKASSKGRWRHLFWFDSGFIGELIGLGYADAERQRGLLERLLGDA